MEEMGIFLQNMEGKGKKWRTEKCCKLVAKHLVLQSVTTR